MNQIEKLKQLPGIIWIIVLGLFLLAFFRESKIRSGVTASIISFNLTPSSENKFFILMAIGLLIYSYLEVRKMKGEKKR
tara:strand:+ start:1242 stop:1478 length:237 start_codon:yes stop_codon:yes gene_type:complete